MNPKHWDALNRRFTALEDAQQRLSNNVRSRPDDLVAIVKAKAELTRSMQGKRDAEVEVVRLQEIAKQKHADAEAALAAATSATETYAATQLGYNATQADYNVTSAGYRVTSAQYRIDSASRTLESAKDTLHRRDARIAELRTRIGRDQAILRNS